MSADSSIRRNYIYNTLYQILTLITPFVTAPYTARVFGADGVGIQSYTASIVAYFTLFAALGTAGYGQREIAAHRDDRAETSLLFWEIELLSCVTTAAALACWICRILAAEKYTAYYAVLTLSVVSVAFDISWFFGGLELFKYIVLRNSFFKILGIVLLFVFVREKDDLLLYVALSAVTGLLGNLSMWTYLPKFLVKIPPGKLRPFRHLKQTLAYFVPTVATSVYTVLDKTMIGMITESEEENGWYEQATKIVRMTQSVLFSLNTVMSARMSHLFALKKYDEIRQRLLKSFDFLFALAIPVTAALGAVSWTFVPWFFGSGYDKVAALICMMSPLPLVICISNILGCQYLTPSGQRLRSAKGIVAGALVNLALNALLIPRFGASGAAAASVAAEGVISIIYVRMSKGWISWRQIFQKSWKRLAAAAVMTAAILPPVILKSSAVWITLAQIAAGAAVYLLALILMKDEFAAAAFQRAARRKRG